MKRNLAICMTAVPVVYICIYLINYKIALPSNQMQVYKNDFYEIMNKKMSKIKRLPDAIIIGVKKCGTITLGVISPPPSNFFFILNSFSDTFLNYHPNVVTKGEISYFENDQNYKKGPRYYLNQIPPARVDQKIIVKSKAVWYQKDVLKVLLRHKGEKEQNQSFGSMNIPFQQCFHQQKFY